MYTNILDIEFPKKYGFEEVEEGSNFNYKSFLYKNIFFSVDYSSTANNPYTLRICSLCTSDNHIFTPYMKYLAEFSKFEEMDVRDFNLNEFTRSLDILSNISKTF